MEYEVEITLFVIVAILLAVVFFFLFFFKPIRNFIFSHFTIRAYYKTVSKVANENDFFLINQFALTLDDETSGVHIDHILFGDKFIYVIKDRYYKGALAAKEDDQSWVWFPNRFKKQYIDNPIVKNNIRCDRLSMASGFDRSYFISVVLVNDDVFITPFKSSNSTSVVIPLSKFQKYVEMNEKRKDVSKFAVNDLTIAVNDLAALNEYGKKKEN